MNILVVDTNKASLVMTTECCKSCLPKSSIDIAYSGKECLKLIKKKEYHLVIIDFDLPDCDGVMLSKQLKIDYKKPIFITAHPDAVITQDIKNELFHYNDAQNWIAKPIQVKLMAKKFNEILSVNYRLNKRYLTNIKAFISSKKTEKSKALQKDTANIINLSAGGALIKYTKKNVLSSGKLINIQIGKEQQNMKMKKIFNSNETLPIKVNAKVVWTNTKKKLLGLQFLDLSENSLTTFENIMRSSSEI